MKKNILLFQFLVVCGISWVWSQVTQNVVVEHFTNTNCSVCASRNPGFYSNLNAKPEVWHIAYHPSAPYASCFFSMQNKIENDDRTKYYGIFGSTPRLVIQGKAIAASANYSDASIFDPYLNKTSPIQISTSVTKKGEDSLQVEIVISTKAVHSLGNLNLFAGLVEKRVDYNANNGEQIHHDVFRKSLFEPIGKSVVLSTTVQDSITFSFVIYKAPNWAANRLYTMAILNKESDKSLVQAGRSEPTIVSALDKQFVSDFNIYPNPASNYIEVEKGNLTKGTISIFSVQGKQIFKEENFEGGNINIAGILPGIYFVKYEASGLEQIKKIVVEPIK